MPSSVVPSVVSSVSLEDDAARRRSKACWRESTDSSSIFLHLIEVEEKREVRRRGRWSVRERSVAVVSLCNMGKFLNLENDGDVCCGILDGVVA